MVNFEEFHWDILSSINILFLKSADVHWSSKADHFVYHCVCFICVFTFFSSPTYLFLYNTTFIFHLKDVCSQQGYVLKKGNEWYINFWNPLSFILYLRKCRVKKTYLALRYLYISNFLAPFSAEFPHSQDNRVVIPKKKIFFSLFTTLYTFFLYNYSTDLQFLMYT